MNDDTPHDDGAARPYHHGNLREVLLATAEQELEAQGIEGFSLRGVAKRAGVSHAAPAHHFGDVNGLLTVLAAEGFRRLVATQSEAQARAPADAPSQLVASGIGYIEFAERHPALFRLMFASDRPKHEDPRFQETAGAAMAKLVADAARARGAAPPLQEKQLDDHSILAWSLAHGIADLLIAGHLRPVASMAPSERAGVLARILRRAYG